MTAHNLLRLLGTTKRFPSHLLQQQQPKHGIASVAPMAFGAWNTLLSQYGSGGGGGSKQQQHRWMSADADMKHRNIGISAHIDR